MRQAQGKKGDELLFLKSGTRKHHRDFVRYWVQRICRDTRVPEVTAHGMRGTHASLAQASRVSALAVARALGHASSAVTQAHYTRPEATEQARQATVLRLLVGEKS